MNKLGSIENLIMDETREESYYFPEIGEVMARMHGNIPTAIYNTTEVPVSTNIREEFFEGKFYSRAVMYLLTNGCEWALKGANGCTMCGHLVKQTRRDEQISDEDLISQFRKEFALVDFVENPFLNLYNNGSFLNKREISAYARNEILKIISSNKDIKMLVLETRPEFVCEDDIIEIKELLPDIHVEVAIGLELFDDYYRAICINKGFTLSQYDKAAKIITKYLNLRTYVLLKPPFLTENESIEEACKAIEHAFSMGSRTVSIEGCTVQDHTLVKYLYDLGMYNPPKLWSIIEVIKRVKAKGQLIIGMFQFYPSPDTVPNNCERCNKNINDKFKLYNQTLDREIFNSLSCDCIQEWEKLQVKPTIPFNMRVENFITEMKRDY